MCVGQSASMGTSFCNNNTETCSSNNGCLDKQINVSGIGTLSLSQVLNAIQVNMGSSSCQANLTTYDFTLIAPDGTTLNFITNVTSSSTSGWINTTWVDNSALERIASYTTTVQNQYNPWSIGYYAPDVTGSFASTFNGINADGTWTFRVCEQSASSMISFNSVCISFGPPVSTFNASSSNLNDCAQAQCIDNTTLVTASNNGYSNGDPLYPGNTFDGCSWNGANNNSAWFYFTPTGTTAQIVLSGIQAVTTGSSDTQPIILENTNGNDCPTSPASWNVPTGGCPDDESINNSAYLQTPNGGGITTSGNVYSNGITANTEFNLTGLTPNKIYYLLVDGNGGAASTFMVQLNTIGTGEGANGAISCNITLPIELLNFEIDCEDNYLSIVWQTASEYNNDYFLIQHTFDGFNFTNLGTLDGAGTTSEMQSYRFPIYEPAYFSGYFRLKQVDFDGQFEFSPIRYSDCTSDNPFVQIINGQLVVSNVDMVINCAVYDLTGRQIFNSNSYEGFNGFITSSFYYVVLETRTGISNHKVFAH